MRCSVTRLAPRRGGGEGYPHTGATQVCEAIKREYDFLGGFDLKKGTDFDHFV